MATAFLASHQLGKRVPNLETAILLMAKANELRMTPLTGLSQLYVVNGVVAIQGQGMLELIYRSREVGVQYLESTPTRAVVRMTRPSTGTEFTADWSIERARASGLGGNDVWKRFPTEMLRWKAVAEAARLVAPDIIGGLYAAEEFGCRSIDDLTPEIVSMEVRAPGVGPDIAEELRAVCNEAIAAGAEKAALLEGMATIKREFGAEKLEQLPQAGADAIHRLVSRLTPEPVLDADPIDDEPEEEPE